MIPFYSKFVSGGSRRRRLWFFHHGSTNMAHEFRNYDSMPFEICIWGFLGSEIMNPEMKNSRWRIQYGGQVMWWWFYPIQNLYMRVFGVGDYDSIVNIGKFRIADPIPESTNSFWGPSEAFTIMSSGRRERAWGHSQDVLLLPFSTY